MTLAFVILVGTSNFEFVKLKQQKYQTDIFSACATGKSD